MLGGKNIFETMALNSQIFKNRDIITPYYIPERLPFREKQIEDISKTLSIALQNAKPDNLFIYGQVGTGKTATINYVSKQLEEYAQKRELPIKIIYINCIKHNTEFKILSKILKKFNPSAEYIGFGSSQLYDSLMEIIQENKLNTILIFDEIDKIKATELNDLIYSLTRANSELERGNISIIGISNNLRFKENLDIRTKSSLCEKEMVFPPYNAEELRAILRDRIEKAFLPNVVEESAISLASAFAAKESGDARTAVMLMLRAGEIAEKNNLDKITDKEVSQAKKQVEEEVILRMISSLPKHPQILLLGISKLTKEKGAQKRIYERDKEVFLFSGEVYKEYEKYCYQLREQPLTARRYRQYINELETYGLVITTGSGKGIRGNTRLIKLAFDAEAVKKIIEQNLVF